MPGFNYGGKGDGTSWSSERGSGPAPGGGSTGNSGNRDPGGNTGAPQSVQKQLAAIQHDSSIRQKLTNLLATAKK
ncbi:hypothetical protein [Cedecea colo]|uniref:Uncharacterized protein n=1 Tax=Cedecea colo TaxID=2552946 RepID=A0ABX0VNA7_9ENTR|nr:hypothetical protein [Cedecea colo]NIY48164.1 hypothetical protein [Cedecea colo]